MRVLAAALLLGLAPAARADIAVLGSGMTLKVSSYRIEGGTVFLTLKDGGEVGTPLAQLRGIVPDEVVEEVMQAAPGTPASDLRALAADAARRHGLEPALVLAVVEVESAFKPSAVSPKGAKGLMQLMPGTADSLGVKDPLDPRANLDGGTRHLRDLVDSYHGDLALALAAYNAGAEAVRRHGGVPPYPETRDYVRKVLSRYPGAHESPR